MPDALAPRYFLNNFERLLAEVRARYADLLSDEERAFLAAFEALPEEARSLLVRLVMRRHDSYRRDALNYPDIADLDAAARRLADHGLVALNQPIDAAQLGTLVTKPALIRAFGHRGVKPAQRKEDILAAVIAPNAAAQPLHAWLQDPTLTTIHLTCRDRVDAFRLLFFGNLRQEWSEFVVSELGHVRYETVPFRPEDRAFTARSDIEACLHLHHLHAQLDAGSSPADLIEALVPPDNIGPVVAARWAKFQHRLGEAAEKAKDWALARACYEASRYKLSRHRLMRVYEQLKAWPQAWAQACEILESPVSEAEQQAVRRALPRLARQVGQTPPALPARHAPMVQVMTLPQAPTGPVEIAVAQALTSPACTVHWLENTLFNGLFGLIFWDVIFASVPGAFFHPFQSGPADLYHPEFVTRRRDLIDAVLDRLEQDDLVERVLDRYREKHGLQNPFVVWPVLHEDLLCLALTHIPRGHLRSVFDRLLLDLRANTSGFPDLIAFDRDQGSYALLEVKGPGDRVQDNQARWMDHFHRHGIPCRVIHVSWPTP